MTRSKSLNKSATIMIKLMSSSTTNDLLATLHNADVAGKRGAGVTNLYIRDRNGRALYTAVRAWISNPPSVTFDKGDTVREWTIRCHKLERFDGGR